MQQVIHNHTCKMAFGRPSKHSNCPRCEELKQGSAPRKGWITATSIRKDLYSKSISQQIREHSCLKSNCGPVCTAFEW